MKQRQIKFRAWIGDMEDKKMSEPFEIYEAERVLNPFWDEPLMQFTGLSDKDSTEIYEGDIVSLNPIGASYVEEGEVMWQEDSWWVKGFHGKNYRLYEDIFSKPKVIGNIYQNPELLK
jgi:uncharacterized phage protein (TIGR01671 family)